MKKTIRTIVLSALPFLIMGASLPNPLGDIKDPESLIIRIIQVFLGFLSLIGLIMFLYGGFMFLTSGGNAERVKKAKGTLVWASAGILTIMGSYAVLQFVFELLQQD